MERLLHEELHVFQSALHIESVSSRCKAFKLGASHCYAEQELFVKSLAGHGAHSLQGGFPGAEDRIFAGSQFSPEGPVLGAQTSLHEAQGLLQPAHCAFALDEEERLALRVLANEDLEFLRLDGMVPHTEAHLDVARRFPSNVARSALQHREGLDARPVEGEWQARILSRRGLIMYIHTSAPLLDAFSASK